MDVVVEATGQSRRWHPARPGGDCGGQACRHGHRRGDVLAGPLLAEEARKAGVVYSLAYGDQPALTAEWWTGRARPAFASSRRQGHQVSAGLSRRDAGRRLGPLRVDGRRGAVAGMNPQMFNSFLDGTNPRSKWPRSPTPADSTCRRRPAVSALRRRRPADM